MALSYLYLQVTLDEANAMLAEFDTEKESAMDTLTDGDEGIQVLLDMIIRGHNLTSPDEG